MAHASANSLKRRYVTGLADTQDSIVGLTTDRGYTEHEMLDELGIIHMNGRIYDPLIGRFMSADPYIQAPDNLQSYNRYAYVMNNPLLYMDPTGYFSWKKFLKVAAVVAITVWTAGALSNYMIVGASNGFAVLGTNGLSTAFVTLGGEAGVLTGLGAAVVGATAGFAAGFAGAALNGANFRQSLNAGAAGAFSGAAFGYVGAEWSAGSAGNYAGHAVAGCATSVAGGGKCGEGAASALVGKWVTNHTDGWNDFNKGVATTVSGGVTSVIMVGNFKNGAETAAYGYLYNYCSDPNNCKLSEKIAKLLSYLNNQGPLENKVAQNSKFCATAECAAGILPAPIDNRTIEQMDRDLNLGICMWGCGLALPLPPLPGTSFPKKATDYSMRAIDYLVKDQITAGVCTWVCKTGK